MYNFSRLCFHTQHCKRLRDIRTERDSSLNNTGTNVAGKNIFSVFISWARHRVKNLIKYSCDFSVRSARPCQNKTHAPWLQNRIRSRTFCWLSDLGSVKTFCRKFFSKYFRPPCLLFGFFSLVGNWRCFGIACFLGHIFLGEGLCYFSFWASKEHM